MQATISRFLRSVLSMGFTVAAAVASPSGSVPTSAPASAAEVHDIDWRTSPLDLNLRGLNGERFQYRCPPGKAAPGLVVGTHLYADNSAICAAATHAGVLRPSVGGLVTIEICPGAGGYRGSDRHFVTSGGYDGRWGGSFIVWRVATDTCPAPTRGHRGRRRPGWLALGRPV